MLIMGDSAKKNMQLRASDVDKLLEKSSITEIETSLVVLFVEKNNISTKNKLITEILSKAKKSSVNKISDWLSKRNVESTLPNIERIFELLIEPKDRKINGAHYTPKKIVDYIISKTLDKKQLSKTNLSICDCSCGNGAFLIGAINKIHDTTKKPIYKIIEENIFGFDFIKRNIRRTQIILTLLMLSNGENKENIKFNLSVVNSLTYTFQRRYDVVIGNPPYIRAKNLSVKMREIIHTKWQTSSFAKAEIFIPFVELGLKLLNEDGVLGYIMPNNYFTSVASKPLRIFLKENQYVKEIVDFTHVQVFQDASAYTCITIFDKKPKNSFSFSSIKNEKEYEKLGKQKQFMIKFSDLVTGGWQLLPPTAKGNISKLESNGMKLGEMCTIRTGLATLNNDVYVIKDAELNNGNYKKIFNNTTFYIEPGITKEVVKGSRIKNEDAIVNNKNRIIFPYYKDNGKAKIIPEDVLKSKYPLCYKYLLARKKELSFRDKGKGEYPSWYAYGRSQGLLYDEKDEKLITPDIGYDPHFVMCKKNILFYIGYALWLNKEKVTSEFKLEILQKILNSEIFKYYIHQTSRNYAGGYKSYAKHFLENFTIPTFTSEEIKLINKSSTEELNDFLSRKYGIVI